MALGNTIIRSVGSYNQLRLVWTASQDIPDNTSTVTAKLYWEATRSGVGPIYSSSSRTASVKINGNTKSVTTNAGLSAGQSRLLLTHVVTVPHNSDGTKSFALSGTFDLSGIKISGVDYGSETVSDTDTLNTIPRASSISSSLNWVAGIQPTFSISRASSSFTHTLKVYVDNVLIKTVTGVGASTKIAFTVAEHTKIFAELAGGASKASKVEVFTYSGGTHIGTTTDTGTVTAPYGSTLTTGTDRDVYTDQAIALYLDEENTGFLHKLVIQCNGVDIVTIDNVGSSITWTPTAAQQTAMHNAMKTVNSADGNIEIYTSYGGNVVRSFTNNDINFYVRDAKPTFDPAKIRYEDTEPTTFAITADKSVIVQNRSKLRVFLDAAAAGQKGATISKYELTVNGVPKTGVANNFVDFGTVDAAVNVTMILKVIDSRGNFSTYPHTVKILAYEPPSFTINAERLEGFQNATTVEVAGEITSINGKNVIKTATIYHKNIKTAATSTTSNLGITGTTDFTATPVVYQLDNQNAYQIFVTVEDSLGPVTLSAVVEAGRPILFIDSEKGSIGIGDFPVGNNEMYVSGRIVFGSTHWASSGQGEGLGALFMNNSDITGINGLWMNDVANGNNGEGIMYLKSGKTSGSSVVTDYDQFYMRDGVVYTNNDDGIKVPHLHVWSGGDVSVDSVGIGLTVGASETSGTRVKIDVNEIAAFSGTSPSTLHVNPDGGIVHVGVNSSIGTQALEVTGTTRINGSGGNTLDIYANDHAYIQWYVKNSSTRSGYLGWGAGASNDMTIANAIGSLKIVTSGGGSLNVVGSGTIGRLESTSVYGQTTSSAANVYVWSTGLIARSTSASKYKLDIEPINSEDLSDRLLYLQPKSWYDKAASEELAEYMTREFNGEEHEHGPAPYLKRHYGLIAEDLIDLGLGMFIQYGEADEFGNREVEGIEYDRAWVLLIPTVKKQRDEIITLKEEVKEIRKLLLGGTQNESTTTATE